MWQSSKHDFEGLNIADSANQESQTVTLTGAEFALSALRSSYIDDTIYVVKYGIGGTPATNWEPDGLYGAPYLDRFQVAHDTLLARGDTPRVVALYIQGEYESANSLAFEFGSRFEQVVNEWRDSIGADIPFYIPQIFTADADDSTVNAQMQAVADTANAVYVIDTDTAGTSDDDLHWNYTGMKALVDSFYALLDVNGYDTVVTSVFAVGPPLAGGGGTGASHILNTYTSGTVEYAFSFTLLDTTYAGDCFAVKRPSDNAVQAIGFVDGYADTATLKTFCGAQACYIDTFYDQSGNENDLVRDATKPTFAFVTDASGNLYKEDDKMAAYTNGGNVRYNFASAASTEQISIVASQQSQQWLLFTSGSEKLTLFTGQGFEDGAGVLAGGQSTTTTLQNSEFNHFWFEMDGTSQIHVNGALRGTGSTTAPSFARWGFGNTSTGNPVGLTFEIIGWQSVTADRAAITQDIETYYNYSH